MNRKVEETSSYNKYEESYKMLLDITDNVKNDIVVQEVLKDMKELVEKYTPKKVLDDICPNCKLDTGTVEQDYYGNYIRIHKFCNNCGQALDWSNK